MCKAIEDMRNEVAEAAGRARSIQIAQMMIADGESDDKVAKYTGLTLQEVQSLGGRQPA